MSNVKIFPTVALLASGLLIAACSGGDSAQPPTTTLDVAPATTAVPVETTTSTTISATSTTTTTATLSPTEQYSLLLEQVEACQEQPYAISPVTGQADWPHEFLSVSTSCDAINADPDFSLLMSISWLRVAGTGVDQIINDALEDLGTCMEEAFIDDTLACAGDFYEGTGSFPEIGWSINVSFDSPRLLGVTVNSGAYWYGRARMEYSSQQIFFDLDTGQQLAATDIFSPGVDWASQLAPLVAAAVFEKYPDAEDAGWDLSEELTNFSPNPEGLTFTLFAPLFRLYEDPVVTIGWTEVSDLLDPDGPLADFIVAPPNLDTFTLEVLACRHEDPAVTPVEHHAGWVNTYTAKSLSCSHPNEWGGVDFEVQWVQVAGPLASQTINAAVESYLDTELDQYIEWAIETADYNMTANWMPGSGSFAHWGTEITMDSPNLVSVVIRHWSYFSGAANGNESAQTFNFNAETGQLITLESLFSSDSEWVASLGQLAFDSLNSEVEGVEPLENWRGWPSPAVFGHFALSPSGLQLNFDEYSVAPGYLGGLSVTLPWASLESIINIEGPMGYLYPTVG